MIKYLITFVVIIIGNWCYLHLYYFKKRCIPISQISADRQKSYRDGREDKGKECETKAIREKEKHLNETLRLTIDFQTELDKANCKIEELEREAKYRHKREIEVENKHTVIKNLTNRTHDGISELSDFLRKMDGRFETIQYDANRMKNPYEIKCENINKDPEQQEGEK